MNAHKVAATLMEDGILVLKGLPFHAGDTVEIIILEQQKDEPLNQKASAQSPLQGTVLRYDEPFEPVADKDYLVAVAATMTEWNSESTDRKGNQK